MNRRGYTTIELIVLLVAAIISAIFSMDYGDERLLHSGVVQEVEIRDGETIVKFSDGAVYILPGHIYSGIAAGQAHQVVRTAAGLEIR